ncbi:hypothetical protein PM082_007072 [Marasmius tenuissimus]|nr:hypothetical protein PM082_007072 [Marasmius tenuissimus]
MLSWMSRTALELIGQAGLGYSFDPLTDEECAHAYPSVLKELFPLYTRTLWARAWLLVPFVRVFSPRLGRFLALHLPIGALKRGRELSDYMWEVSTEIYRGKLRALEEGNEAVHEQVGKGKDIISVLINENMKTSEEDKLDEDEVIGQASRGLDSCYLCTHLRARIKADVVSKGSRSRSAPSAQLNDQDPYLRGYRHNFSTFILLHDFVANVVSLSLRIKECSLEDPASTISEPERSKEAA